jgi:hypothetical protein
VCPLSDELMRGGVETGRKEQPKKTPHPLNNYHKTFKKE